MGDYNIRRYEDRDYEAARTMFSQGIKEHVPTAFRHAVRCSRLPLLGVFLVACVASGSFLFSLGVVSTLLVAGWICMRSIWTDYVQTALAGDMLDIRRTYLEPKDCCFWVVEAGEEVAGTVAAVHPEDPALQGSALELKRMSVKKEHRGRGISKALTRTVLRFAQERGYQEVVLYTSMVQSVAQRLYEGLGFRKAQQIYPSRLAKLLQFHIYYYRYEITGSR